MKKYFLLLTLALLAGCEPAHDLTNSNVDDTTEEIVGGDSVSRFDSISKHLAFIYSENSETYCTGTIIGPNLILTAAHCIQNPNESLNIAFGLEFDGNMEIRHSIGSITHREFRQSPPQERNDIALLKFAGTLPEGYYPAPLATASVMAKSNSEIIVVGFGRANGAKNLSADEAGSGRLRKVSVKIESVSANKKLFEVNQKSGRGICYGDSGGPAFIKAKGKYYVVGITSAVLWYASKHSPKDPCQDHSGFMNVHTYLPWIEKYSRSL